MHANARRSPSRRNIHRHSFQISCAILSAKTTEMHTAYKQRCGERRAAGRGKGATSYLQPLPRPFCSTHGEVFRLIRLERLWRVWSAGLRHAGSQHPLKASGEGGGRVDLGCKVVRIVQLRLSKDGSCGARYAALAGPSRDRSEGRAHV